MWNGSIRTRMEEGRHGCGDLPSRKDLLPSFKECNQEEPPAIKSWFYLSYRGHSSPSVCSLHLVTEKGQAILTQWRTLVRAVLALKRSSRVVKAPQVFTAVQLPPLPSPPSSPFPTQVVIPDQHLLPETQLSICFWRIQPVMGDLNDDLIWTLFLNNESYFFPNSKLSSLLTEWSKHLNRKKKNYSYCPPSLEIISHSVQ